MYSSCSHLVGKGSLHDLAWKEPITQKIGSSSGAHAPIVTDMRLCTQAHLQSQGIDVRSVRVVSFMQLPAGTSVTTQVWGAPAAAPAPAASPPAGVDMATVGKGVGVSYA